MNTTRNHELIKPLHALSFDVEEHFQVSAFWTANRRRQWDCLESRVEMNTRKIAELLECAGIKVTFFVLGWVAERNSRLIRYLAESGHEVASHGYGHELVTSLTPSEFRSDVRKAKVILEDIVGRSVMGYRAPSFSISGAERDWALQILVEEGHVYDSSLYFRFQSGPARKQATDSCYVIETGAGTIFEAAPAAMKAMRMNIPVGGGGYFRLVPYSIMKLLLKRLEKRGEQIVLYFHPWEIDPSQPRMEGSMVSRMRHYMNLDKTEGRLRTLLQDFAFGPIATSITPIRQKISEDVVRDRKSESLAESSQGPMPFGQKKMGINQLEVQI